MFSARPGVFTQPFAFSFFIDYYYDKSNDRYHYYYPNKKHHDHICTF